MNLEEEELALKLNLLELKKKEHLHLKHLKHDRLKKSNYKTEIQINNGNNKKSIDKLDGILVNNKNLNIENDNN